LRPEIVVVDNGSADHTAEVVRSHPAARIPARLLSEPTSGKSRALNMGMASTSSELILFTDDDVAATQDWLAQITTPLLQGRCHGVAGHVELAKDCCRTWMKQEHLVWLAASQGQPLPLIGANIGIHRSVLDRIPAFDVELGPGASGFGEDTLFSWQLSEAGFRLEYIPQAVVVHHPDPSRLLRSNWLAVGHKYGVSAAYLLYHWEHTELRNPRLRACYMQLKLLLRKTVQPPTRLDGEGIASWEMSYVAETEKYRQFLIERRRPRNYFKRGLRKLCLQSSQQSCPSPANV